MGLLLRALKGTFYPAKLYKFNYSYNALMLPRDAGTAEVLS